MHFLIPLPCGAKLQIDPDLGVPVIDAKARDGPMLVADCLPRQPSCVMVCAVAVRMNVTVGSVALLHIQNNSPNQGLMYQRDPVVLYQGNIMSCQCVRDELLPFD